MPAGAETPALIISDSATLAVQHCGYIERLADDIRGGPRAGRRQPRHQLRQPRRPPLQDTPGHPPHHEQHDAQRRSRLIRGHSNQEPPRIFSK
jgi:hypothetical protein